MDGSNDLSFEVVYFPSKDVIGRAKNSGMVTLQHLDESTTEMDERPNPAVALGGQTSSSAAPSAVSLSNPSLQASSSAPSVASASPSLPAIDESAQGQAEALLLKRKLHHLMFIQEQQAKLLELEKALTAAQAQ